MTLDVEVVLEHLQRDAIGGDGAELLEELWEERRTRLVDVGERA